MDYFDNSYYNRRHCKECGERISFEEYKENDGLCDLCFNDYMLDDTILNNNCGYYNKYDHYNNYCTEQGI